MNESEKNLDQILDTIDNIELIPEEEMNNMDFYELSYYMQTLNMIDSITEEGEE